MIFIFSLQRERRVSGHVMEYILLLLRKLFINVSMLYRPAEPDIHLGVLRFSGILLPIREKTVVLPQKQDFRR